MKKALRKDAIKEIKKSYKRFLSIVIMAMLGVGFFVGIKASGPNMRSTLDAYFDDKNVFDIKVLSTLGLTNEDVDEMKKLQGIKEIYGAYDKDAILEFESSEYVLNVMEYNENMNQVDLIEGTVPQNETECMVEQRLVSQLNLNVGDYIKLREENDDETEEKVFKNTNLKIVGIIRSPLYISEERGNSKLGSGKINYYIYISKENIDSDIYTSIYISIEGVKQLEIDSKKYGNKVGQIKEEIKQISEQREQARYDSLIEEATKKLNDAEQELNTQKEKAQEELTKAQKKIEDAQKELLNGEKELNENIVRIEKEFTSAEEALKQSEIEYEQSVMQAQEGIDQATKSLESLNAQFEQVSSAIEAIDLIYENSDDSTKLILEEQRKDLESNKVQIESSIIAVKETILSMNKGIEDGKIGLENAKKTIEQNKKDTYIKLEKAKRDIEDGKQEIENGKKELEENRMELEEKVQEAQEKLSDAKEKIKDIEHPKWYIFDRKEANAGYYSFYQDSQSIDNISKVFPLMFFAVATLMSLTSMTRMVDEQRTTIGTLKALGYSKLQISSKYLIYSILATLLGSITGVILGYGIIPPIIVNAYLILYELPLIPTVYDWNLIISGFLIISICIVGGALYTSFRKLRHVPATLMRPKAPKAGKRVLLERVSFIWKKLKFTQKVTIRNIFRYKKRFLMTIIGIMGATALVLVGFGIKDSVAKVIPTQYEEIYQYNMVLGIKDSITQQERETLIEKMKQKDQIQDLISVNMQGLTVIKEGTSKDVQLMVISEEKEISEFIKLRNPKTKQDCKLEDNSVIITQRLAKILDIKQSDIIKIKNEDGIEKEVIVSQITEQYLGSYVYMTNNLYEQLYEEEIKINVFLVNTIQLNQSKEEEIGKELLSDYRVSSVSLLSDPLVSKSMKTLDYVVVVLIISASLLTFIVLYNLSNVNITERMRELATLKVLGFYDNEVSQYVSREMTILTIIGILLGMIAGYFLNSFVLQAAEQDLLMFPRVIEPISYAYAAIMVIASSVIVNVVAYFALKKVDMVESLKSIE